jgi:hypothetical protein
MTSVNSDEGAGGPKARPHAPASTAAVSERSTPGQNEWNRGREPKDWWGEMLRYHGHVGPWNVVGWRMGKAALREFNAQWGDHTLDIVVHLPLTTPYTCIADGLTVATGNSIGRLDIRLAEELSSTTLHVSIRSKAQSGGPVLEFWPKPDYMLKIESRPASQLEALARGCAELDERELFEIRRR